MGTTEISTVSNITLVTLQGSPATTGFMAEVFERIAELDKLIETEQKRMDELTSAMADPAFYEDAERSTEAIAEHALLKKRLAEHEEESALRSVKKLTTKDVFDAAKNGDSAANAILENVYDAFGYAISAVCTVADPEVVVIGGGVSKAGEMLVEGAKKGFLKYVFYPSTDVRFNLAVLGNDAGMYGCCKLLLDSLA